MLSIIHLLIFSIIHAALFTLMQLLEICKVPYHVSTKWKLRVSTWQWWPIASLLLVLPISKMLSKLLFCDCRFWISSCWLFFTCAVSYHHIIVYFWWNYSFFVFIKIIHDYGMWYIGILFLWKEDAHYSGSYYFADCTFFHVCLSSDVNSYCVV